LSWLTLYAVGAERAIGPVRLTKDSGFFVIASDKGAIMKANAVAISFLCCLAACGGGGGGGIDPRLTRLDIYEAQKLRVLGDPEAGVTGMPMTADANAPTTGAMSFAGFATMRVENGAQPLILFGDANLQLDFDNNAAQGAVTNVFGGSTGAQITDYVGSIDLQSDVVSQNMPLNYQGRLSAEGQTLGFNGAMAGVLLGNPASAFVGGDLESQVDHNGTTREATFVIALEEVSP
jgi:hypothetical protein